MKREQKQEASMSVQSRISAATLTELDIYWMSESKKIKSISQLVSWSLDLLCEILWANQKLRRRVESIAEARKYLMERELIQPSLYERGFDKLGTAVTFEGMREAGIDPSRKLMSGRFVDNSNITRKYNMLHNERSVQPFTGTVDSELLKKGIEIMNNLPKDRVSSIMDELSGISPLRESDNSPEAIAEHIKAIDKVADAQLDELNSFDPMSLIGKAVKEKGE